jgi:hypothetical protein
MARCGMTAADEDLWAGTGEWAEPPERPPEQAPSVPPRYGDVAALLAGGIPPPPAPAVLRRDDGRALFYPGKINILFGDPECGKTWVGDAAVAETLNNGGRGAILDLDHNGMEETVTRLLLLGAKPDDLGNLDRFRYCDPEEPEELIWYVQDLRLWLPHVVLVDSIGEVLPMLGYSSSNPDEYTKANRQVMTPLAAAGAAVIGVDHLPKDDDARTKGQTGTMAKKRTVNGVTLRVAVKDQFAPGHGGSCDLTIEKDRPGGLRQHCPTGKRPPAGRFVMTAHHDGTVSWRITSPPADSPSAVLVPDDDVAELDGLVPAPTSRRDVMTRCGWGTVRAGNALDKWRELRKPEVPQ